MSKKESKSIKTSSTILVPVEPRHYRYLYKLLKERPAECRIFHQKTPPYSEHVKFHQAKPYKHSMVIYNNTVKVGFCYLSKLNEIGIFIEKKHQNKGYARDAIKQLMELESGPFLANIAPGNFRSQYLFTKLGFKLIQETFKK